MPPEEGIRGLRVALHDLGGMSGALDQLHEVVREAVVVIDDQDHGSAPSAPATAGSNAAAFAFVSASSASGSDSATMPAPVCTWAAPFAITTVRIVMQKSRSPWNVR